MELTALDKLEIMEVAARFEMALDKEDVEAYLQVYAEGGALSMFGQTAQGEEALRQGFWVMLDMFARGKRHCSMNQIITGDGAEATMTSYLVVFNRNDLHRGGSALVVDQVRKDTGRWGIVHRQIDVDPSLSPSASKP